MLRVPLIVATVLALAFGLGVTSTLFALKASSGFGSIRLGAWVAFPELQTANADPYARAHRAFQGRLLLGGDEGLSFVADADDAGDPLDPACSYRLSGDTPQARFFTLFAADKDGRPLDAGNGLPSAYNSRTVLREANGDFSVTVGPDAAPGNWLAIGAVPGYRLVFNLYDTPTAGSSGVIDLAMPAIVRIGCRNA